MTFKTRQNCNNDGIRGGPLQYRRPLGPVKESTFKVLISKSSHDLPNSHNVQLNHLTDDLPN